VELVLRFIGYSKVELEAMEEKEVWRKAFAAMDLVREFMEGISSEGGGTGSAVPPAPAGFDPMAAYGASGPE
jgi:hypothetical protein